MKTLLLQLPKNLDKRYDYDQVAQPLGLACISSYMKSQGKDVVLFDAHAHHMDREQILDYVAELAPDLVGLSIMTYHLPAIMSFLADLKQRLPHIKAMVGGPHVNAELDKVLRLHPEVDFAIMGEGEFTTVELVDTLNSRGDLSGIKGLVYRDGDAIIVNGRRPYIEDLDALPYPDWESLPIEKYWDVFTTKKNYARLFASRGCPFSCSFCGAPRILGRKVRKRSPQHILGELEMLYDTYGVREFLFNDSTFNIDNDWVGEICQGIIDMKRPLVWRCNVRADRVELETIKLMKKAGCVKVIMGVESADEAMLQSMQKGETLEEIKRGIAILKEAKMPSDHGFIIGMPGDTEESILKSIEFAKEIKASVVTFSLATPFPGTAFYERAMEEGMVVEDWSKFDFFSVPYVPQGITKERMLELYKHAVRTFYLRPSYLINRLFEMRSLTNLRINLWYAFRIFSRSFFNKSNK
ncbi:B12-binding domain-containing radical SAM protein [Pseudodesulfovibrio sp.]|nr:B12-binding domain-containing radical SAM protein [Pseudodesulfovibrio sp.]